MSSKPSKKEMKKKRPLEEIPEEEEPEKKQKTEEPPLEVVRIRDGGILKWNKNFITPEEADALYDHLVKEFNWVQGEIKMYGKKINTPRMQSWVADEGLVVKGLFQKQKQHPWTEPLLKVRRTLEGMLGCTFDYLLLNWYRDGKDYIGYHADREAIPNGKDVIASVSLGETRRFLIKHRTSGEVLEYQLTKGSLIVMQGTTQKHWKHTVPKEPKVKNPRINLTFRIN